MATLSQTAEPALRTSDDQPRVKGSVVAAAVAGNALEFYDFTTYAFFAVYIGETFFPSHDPLMSVLLSVAVFGVGFITRPIGGIVIGAFADRVGRKPAMLLTIALITVGTLGLCLTPSYASIGVAAPIIVVCMRLIQGFALGGEVGPSSSYQPGPGVHGGRPGGPGRHRVHVAREPDRLGLAPALPAGPGAHPHRPLAAPAHAREPG